MPTKPRPLIITPGEPGGVGAEITAKAWVALHSNPAHCFALLSDVTHVKARLAEAGLAVPVSAIASVDEAAALFGKSLPVLHRPLSAPVVTGQFAAATAPWVMDAIREAVTLCLSGAAAGMVTSPIQKEALYSAGFTHQGHTDFLAALTREAGHPAQDVMMLVGGGLRSVPVTVHIALKDVPHQLTQSAITTQARVVHQALQRQFGVAHPRIAISGLNPHAGENGSMGREEIETILPAIAELKAEGLDVFGPLPADTAFFPHARRQYDAILCMYHDQALIPVKTLDFHGGVNVTLGLPFIRTSPDHGTALGIAGTGKADGLSMQAAITLALGMAKSEAAFGKAA